MNSKYSKKGNTHALNNLNNNNIITNKKRELNIDLPEEDEELNPNKLIQINNLDAVKYIYLN